MNKTLLKGNSYTILVYRLIIFLFFLSISRFLLYFFNQNYFSEIHLEELFKMYFLGLRFDIAALIMLNSPLILFSILPFNFNKKDRLIKYVLYITLIVNSLAIIFNLIDVIYFRFTLKRSTFDILNFLDANVGLIDIFKALLFDFWYMILLAGGMIFILVYASINVKEKDIFKHQKPIQTFYKSILFIFFIGLGIIGMRGGMQLKPINLIDAGRMVSSNQVPLILNTPFSFIVTRGKQQLEQKKWFTPKEAKEIFNPIHNYNRPGLSAINKNVIILILESFSTSKIGYFNPGSKSLTPFLDSLLSESLTFNGIANGKKSIEGIPTILSGIPSLMRQPFLTSSYAANQFSSIASLLNNYGYTSSFFHGGKNGTMNLDSYAVKAGFDYYFGLNEYENKNDYDGSWGIWDHDFYPFFISKLNDFKEPFISAFFSLSSHHPYAIPKEFQSIYAGPLPLDNSLAYSDFALSKFFKSVKKEAWFNNTLFVLTADHTAELPGTRDSSNLIHFEIPIAFFAPNDTVLLNKKHQQIIQQSDILPSILDYLNFPDSFVAFGNSVFDMKSPDFSLFSLNEIYHGTNSKYIFEFDGINFTYKPINDTIISDSLDRIILENQVKALIQNYADFMIHNKLKVDF